MKVKDPNENRRMFDDIARGYDRANFFISLGRYKSWYRTLIKMSGIGNGGKVLDCATGTGNVAIEFKRLMGDKVLVTGVDVAEKMLEIACEKAERAGYDIDFHFEDILDMSFADDSFDVATITFGIRNTVSIEDTLSEMARVVRSGGKVMVLETGQTKGLMRFLYNIYQYVYVNQIGKLVSRHNSAYEWLTESSNDFPSGENFLAIMNKTAKFSRITYKQMMFGTIFIYIAEVK